MKESATAPVIEYGHAMLCRGAPCACDPLDYAWQCGACSGGVSAYDSADAAREAAEAHLAEAHVGAGPVLYDADGWPARR